MQTVGDFISTFQVAWTYPHFFLSVSIHRSSLCVNRCKNGETCSVCLLCFRLCLLPHFINILRVMFKPKRPVLIIYEYANLKGEELSHTTWILHLFLYSVHWHHYYHSDSNYRCCISNYYCCYYIEFVSAVQYRVENYTWCRVLYCNVSFQ